MKDREYQLKVRVEEVQSILNTIEKPGFSKIFGKIDLTRVAVSGHSFGGITALQVGLQNKKIRAVVSLDPTFSPVQEVNDFKVSKENG